MKQCVRHFIAEIGRIAIKIQPATDDIARDSGEGTDDEEPSLSVGNALCHGCSGNSPADTSIGLGYSRPVNKAPATTIHAIKPTKYVVIVGPWAISVVASTSLVA